MEFDLIHRLKELLSKNRLVPWFWQPCFTFSIPGCSEKLVIIQDETALIQFLGFAEAVGFGDIVKELSASRRELRLACGGSLREISWNPVLGYNDELVSLNTWIYGNGSPDQRHRSE